jgi:hypothetical protein
MGRIIRLAAAVAIAAALACGPAPAAAEYQLVGFINEQNVYIDTDRLQYYVDPRTNEVYYDIWTMNVYSDTGRANMIKRVKEMRQYNRDWDNFNHALVHKYFRMDKAALKDVGFVLLTKDNRILELGEIPPDKVNWTPVNPRTLDDDIYKRIKLYEDAYREKMVERSVRNRYKVVGNNGMMTISIDTANAKFFRDSYSGNVYADVWIRLDLSEEYAAAMVAERKQKGGSLKGWNYLGYIINKGCFDFRQNRVKMYSFAYYTRQGALLETVEHQADMLDNWQQPIPESTGEYIFQRVKEYMTGE